MAQKFLWTFEYKKTDLVEELELWVPLPFDKNYQKILKLDVEHSPGAKVLKGMDEAYGFQYLYARFPLEREASLHIQAEIEIFDRINNENIHQALSEEEKVLYLSAKRHVPLSKIVQEISQKICGQISDEFEKARAIYDWVIQHGERDPHQVGCGLGNVEQSLQEGHICGRCVDISSVTVALFRAAGIPAREIFGMRLGPSQWTKGLGRTGDISEAYHCKVEFWTGSRGWQVCDPGDVLKLMLDEQFAANSERAQFVADKLFQGAEANWLGFNSGRDVVLSPSTGMIENYFMYPLGLQLGERLSPYNPSVFGFKVASRQLV